MTNADAAREDDGAVVEGPDGHAGKVRAVDRTVTILRALDDGKWSSLATIRRHTGLDPATTLRFLQALVQHRLVERDEDARYRLAVGLLELARNVRGGDGLRAIARPTMARLAEETGCTAFLLVRNENGAVCVERESTGVAVKVEFIRVGDRVPLTQGAGPRVLLAFGSTADWEERVSDFEGDESLGGPAALLKELAKIRKQGMVVAPGFVAGTAAVGFPVMDAEGEVVASLSVAGIAHELKGPALRQCADAVGKAAAEITAELRQRR